MIVEWSMRWIRIVNCCDILIFSLFLFLQLLFPCFLIVSLTYKEKKRKLYTERRYGGVWKSQNTAMQNISCEQRTKKNCEKKSTLTPLLLSNDLFIKDEFFSYSPSVQ